MLYEHSVYNCKTAGPPCQNSFRKGFNQLSDLLIYMLINGMLWMIIQLISNVLLFTYRCKLSVCMGLGGGEVTIWVSHHYVWTGKICFQMHLQLVRSLRGLARIHTLLLVYIWSFILPNNSFCLACMVFYPLLGDNLSDLKFYDFVTMCMVCTNVAFSSS